VLTIANPENSSVTQDVNMTLTLGSNEPLSQLLVLQPGAAVWTHHFGGGNQVVLKAVGEGQQQAAVKGAALSFYFTSRVGSFLVV
jgi:hypothetical protein